MTTAGATGEKCVVMAGDQVPLESQDDNGALDTPNELKNENNPHEQRGRPATSDGSSRGITSSRLEEEAAVGSITHILKTAFKELYVVPGEVHDVAGESTNPENAAEPVPRPSSETMEAAAATVEGERPQ